MQKFIICNDREFYKAWPDLGLLPDGRLLCAFNECNHHLDRSNTRISLCESSDRGRTWSPKRPLTESTRGLEYYYNCPRISVLSDGELVIAVDRLSAGAHRDGREEGRGIMLYRSPDNGRTWREPEPVPLRGIVPDRLLELPSGRLLIAASREVRGMLTPFCVYSDDRGKSWSSEVMIAHSPELRLAEPSLLPLGGSDIVAFLRENSGRGYDCKKVISHDNGESWSQIIDFPLSGCHRPVARLLADGKIMVTYRYAHGGDCSFGRGAQNFFAALTDARSALSICREDAAVRILPVDYDRSRKADTGYSGQAQFPDGEIYLVNYIVDDAIDQGQIRGYSLDESDFFVTAPAARPLSGSVRRENTVIMQP